MAQFVSFIVLPQCVVLQVYVASVYYRFYAGSFMVSTVENLRKSLHLCLLLVHLIYARVPLLLYLCSGGEQDGPVFLALTLLVFAHHLSVLNVDLAIDFLAHCIVLALFRHIEVDRVIICGELVAFKELDGGLV